MTTLDQDNAEYAARRAVRHLAMLLVYIVSPLAALCALASWYVPVGQAERVTVSLACVAALLAGVAAFVLGPRIGFSGVATMVILLVISSLTAVASGASLLATLLWSVSSIWLPLGLPLVGLIVSSTLCTARLVQFFQTRRRGFQTSGKVRGFEVQMQSDAPPTVTARPEGFET